MGKKIKPPHAPSNQGADDLEILHPEREVTVGGIKVTVREYGFVEGLRMQRDVAPVVQALADAAEASSEGTPMRAIHEVLAAHPDELMALLAQAIDCDAAFMRGLTDADGQTLLMVWWRVNRPFFVRRLVAEVELRRVVRASAGATSTAASSETATTPESSEATPGVS